MRQIHPAPQEVFKRLSQPDVSLRFKVIWAKGYFRMLSGQILFRVVKLFRIVLFVDVEKGITVFSRKLQRNKKLPKKAGMSLNQMGNPTKTRS